MGAFQLDVVWIGGMDAAAGDKDAAAVFHLGKGALFPDPAQCRSMEQVRMILFIEGVGRYGSAGAAALAGEGSDHKAVLPDSTQHTILGGAGSAHKAAHSRIFPA